MVFLVSVKIPSAPLVQLCRAPAIYPFALYGVSGAHIDALPRVVELPSCAALHALVRLCLVLGAAPFAPPLAIWLLAAAGRILESGPRLGASARV
jgi:hypothetical protein